MGFVYAISKRAGMLTLAVVLALGAAEAQATGYEDLQRCAALEGSAEASDGVAACTAAISSDELTEQNLAIAYYNRGNAHRRLGDFAKAVADFTEAIKLWPDLDQAWNNRGSAQARLCQRDAALADFKKAMEIDPTWVRHYQDALKRAGVDIGVVDGQYGPKTESGLIALIDAQCQS